MTIEFQCECGRTLQAPKEYAGRNGTCPACQKMITVPETTGGLHTSAAAPNGVREDGGGEEKGPEGFGSAVKEPLQDRQQRRSWFRSPRFLMLAVGLVVLLVAVIGFTVVRQEKPGSESVVTLEKVTPLPEKSQSKTVHPAGTEPKGEMNRVEETLPMRSLLTPQEEVTEEPVIEMSDVEQEQTAQQLAEVREETEHKVVTLEERPETMEKVGPLPGSYTVNLASFREEARADRFVRQLREKGLEAFCWEIDLPEKGKWHRVSVGNFPTLEYAKSFAAQERLKENYSVFITRIPGG